MYWIFVLEIVPLVGIGVGLLVCMWWGRDLWVGISNVVAGGAAIGLLVLVAGVLRTLLFPVGQRLLAGLDEGLLRLFRLLSHKRR